ncbi:MAG: hypothetical protein JXA38_08360 [Methanosarcinaceae archaeon]|nr:hypothetical protein [Methanosarcinaceae archaeon]
MEDEKRQLESGIKEFLYYLSEKYSKSSFYGRIVQGDYIECALESPEYALRIALLLKTLVKSFYFNNSKDKRLKYFNEHGIRLAVAIAPLNRLDPKKGIIDGEAIYLSGRTIKNLSTSDKQKIIIKNTMFFCMKEDILKHQFDTIFTLLDTIISRCSPKQCEIIHYKLKGFSEKDISKHLKKYQSTISQHSTAAGWLSIEKSVNYFENTFKQ